MALGLLKRKEKRKKEMKKSQIVLLDSSNLFLKQFF